MPVVECDVEAARERLADAGVDTVGDEGMWVEYKQSPSLASARKPSSNQSL